MEGRTEHPKPAGIKPGSLGGFSESDIKALNDKIERSNAAAAAVGRLLVSNPYTGELQLWLEYQQYIHDRDLASQQHSVDTHAPTGVVYDLNARRAS